MTGADLSHYLCGAIVLTGAVLYAAGIWGWPVTRSEWRDQRAREREAAILERKRFERLRTGRRLSWLALAFGLALGALLGLMVMVARGAECLDCSATDGKHCGCESTSCARPCNGCCTGPCSPPAPNPTIYWSE